MRELDYRVWDHGIENWMPDPEDCTVEQLNNLCDCEVEQFIGIKDINKKKIYEGDLVQVKWNCGIQDQVTIGVVLYNDGSRPEVGGLSVTPGTYVIDDFKRRDFLFFCHMEFEVIGNIHENSELFEDIKTNNGG